MIIWSPINPGLEFGHVVKKDLDLVMGSSLNGFEDTHPFPQFDRRDGRALTELTGVAWLGTSRPMDSSGT